LLFDPGDRAALRGHVARLAADRTLLREMAHACRQRADTHTFENTVDRYLQVYSETLN
jgi:glycosyltransferase involved in cell wall biosynthesis